jgi:outer membrane autotransporter protein
MRASNLGGQQVLGSVLDASLLSATDCTPPPAAANGVPSPNVTACQPGVWVQATGDSQQLDGSPGLRSTAFGLLGGFEGAVTDTFHLGVETGVNRLNGNDSFGGNGTIDSAHAGVYAFGNLGPLVLSGTLDGSHASYQVNRNSGIGHSSAHIDGTTYSGGVQIAWPVQADTWQITPKAGALYQHQQLDSFGETVASASPLASAFAVTGSGSSDTTVQPYVELSLGSSFQSAGITYLPQLELGYRYDTRGQIPTVTTIAQDGTLFALPANTVGRGMATAGARINVQAGQTWQLFLDYSGLFASHLHDNALSFGFNKQF